MDPHSGRLDFATDGRLEGKPFTEIREAGRWQSDSSLRTYLDVLAASSVVRAMGHRGMGPTLAAAEVQWPMYFC